MKTELVLFVIGISLISLAVGQSDDFSDSIECYFCRGKYENSTCSNPTPDDLVSAERSGITKGECKRGACVKLIKRDPDDGIMMIERTCSHRIPNFNIIMAEVCRYESNGNGYLCLCGYDFCNHGNGLKFSAVAMVTVLLGYVLT